MLARQAEEAARVLDRERAALTELVRMSHLNPIKSWISLPTQEN